MKPSSPYLGRSERIPFDPVEVMETDLEGDPVELNDQVIGILKKFINSESIGWIRGEIERYFLKYLISLDLPNLPPSQFQIALKEIKQKLKYIDSILSEHGGFKKVGVLSEYAVGCVLAQKGQFVELPTEEEDRSFGVDFWLDNGGQSIAVQVKSFRFKSQPKRYVFDARKEDVIKALYDQDSYPLAGEVDNIQGSIGDSIDRMMTLPEDVTTILIIVPGAFEGADYTVYNEVSGLPDKVFTEELYNQLLALVGGAR